MSDDESDNGEPRYQVVFEDENEPSKYLKKDGKAAAKFANEDTYVGEYRNGKRWGQGVYTWANGARYEGEYVDGLKEGNGKFLTLDGGKYEGQWKADKREGEGKYQYASGDVYSGGWKNNVKHGQGTYFYAKSSSSLTGEWSNGQIMHGTWSMADGSKFVGAWHKNQPSGVGLHTFTNGNQATGKYVIDRKLGYKWESTSAKVNPASSNPPAAVKADPLKVAQRFVEKAVLKIDHFEGISRNFKLVEGCPNFRRIGDLAIFACGQPTMNGFKNFFEYVSEQYQTDKFVWINLRSEPIVYVNDNSFIPRSKHALNSPMTLTPLGQDRAEDEAVLGADQLATIEKQLVDKLAKDISHRGNLHVYLKDTFAELPADRKNLELTEEVLPNEEGTYKEAIRSVAQVYEFLNEEGGADVEYRRLPISSERLTPAADIDALVSIFKTNDASTGLVFNDQMGRGRATFASILATLFRRTQEAFASSEERENSNLARTDIEGLDIPEYDDSDPNYKLGQYGVVMRLVKALPSGDQIKAEVDDAIDRCKVMHHAREAILGAKENLEKDVARIQNGPQTKNTPEELEQRKTFWTNQGQLLLERYVYLLIFQAYVKANIETEFENQTFEAFLSAHPDWLEIIGNRASGAVKDFHWQ